MNYFESLKFLKFEFIKQEKTLNLIASENYSSIDSILYTANCFINKYTEGYPHNRYYPGCKFFDIIENLAILEVQQLFNCYFSNVQPHSGSQANFSALQSLINKNETILSLDLKSGGHLTHGFINNFSGKYFNIVNYFLDKNNMLNEDKILLILKNVKPKILILGFSSYQKDINWKFIHNKVKKKFFILSDISHISGIIASGLISNPLKFSNVLTSTTHKTLRGVKGGIIFTNSIKNKINLSVFPGQQGGCIASNLFGKLISFKNANTKNFVLYTKQILINSKIMLKTFIYRGYNSTILDTDNHLFLINLSNYNVSKLEKILEKNCILINKNFLPNDKKHSLNPSGLRLGTSCITTRYLKNNEVELLSNIICDIIENKNIFINVNIIRLLCKKFPIYK